jgi:hypothetical protein
MRTEISEEQALGTDASHRDTCLGVRAIRFLGSVFRDCLLRLLPRLIPGRVDFFLRAERLLPGGRSQDCTVNIFLHRRRSTTLRNALCRASGAFSTVPSSGYKFNPPSLFFRMSLIIFAMLITSLSSNKIAHMHIYVTTLLIIFF